jgi:hypothetical protein
MQAGGMRHERQHRRLHGLARKPTGDLATWSRCLAVTEWRSR